MRYQQKLWNINEIAMRYQQNLCAIATKRCEIATKMFWDNKKKGCENFLKAMK